MVHILKLLRLDRKSLIKLSPGCIHFVIRYLDYTVFMVPYSIGLYLRKQDSTYEFRTLFVMHTDSIREQLNSGGG